MGNHLRKNILIKYFKKLFFHVKKFNLVAIKCLMYFKIICQKILQLHSLFDIDTMYEFDNISSKLLTKKIRKSKLN